MLTFEDRVDLEEQYRRLALAMDTWDVDAWVNAYAERAVFIGPSTLKGRAAIRDWVESLMTSADTWPLRHTQHRLSNLILDGSGDVARGLCYFAWVGQNKESGAYEIGLLGVYEDRWERIGGRWLVARRQLHEGVPRS